MSIKKKSKLFLIVAAWLLGSAGLMTDAAWAAPVPVAPAAQGFMLGKFQLFALRDMLNVLPNDGKVFGKDVGPARVADALKKLGAPTDKITLGVDALLVRTPDRVVLLDTGLGPKVGGVLMQSLAQTGIRPDQITDVLITHAHGDHVGGLMTADGKLAFPHATVHMSATEWNWMQSKPANKPIVDVIRGMVKTFTPGGEVVPGFRSVAIPGHTPGHVGYQITSAGRHLFDIGDTAHSSLISLADPAWANGYDTDTAQGRASREKILAEVAASHERIFAPHFPFPGIGTIAKAGHAYAWKPARPKS
ncbi:MAG TPA: MBL fold metallo-hydrolase [Stellaceae bacterium]|nr:MBL fold metallo-hydrolase [Stellaceae bacterium]